ncbi:hypothetical protein P171DRAFT_226383 [Karstenula rhodostoma CBS 690.94]|uniref:Uncharacterized protein n=1 Tax=Karstenula rhodostoma CBS 690.94 TaxID=1392251 RepID=A0A9P4PNZ4_9PLEO|nr:hypothetical protein P171DRAFT_226383 [Karstenula rhodostoma CBS 690.94]
MYSTLLSLPLPHLTTQTRSGCSHPKFSVTGFTLPYLFPLIHQHPTKYTFGRVRRLVISRIFHIVFAAMLLASTHYGFGTHGMDMVATGGDLRDARKVCVHLD